MKNFKLTIVCIFLIGHFTSCIDQKPGDEKPLVELTQYVDPQIGSVHGRWFFYTPAARPFGMAKLAPHTNGYNSAGGWGPTG